MEQILRFEKQVPLTYSLMQEAVPEWVQCRLYTELKGFKSLKAASKGKPCLVVLYTMEQTSKRPRGGHYSLVILGSRTRYWSSYGYPVEYEIAISHQANDLKRLVGTHTNDKVSYQAKDHTETCWRWCLLRATLYKMSENRFRTLFYRLNPIVKSPDDVCSLITLGLLGPGYMAEALKSHRN